jgi:type IV secretory pathway TraG/TraD family ATPase VirD4
MIPYFSSKFGPFITNTTIRNIIGQTKSAFNLREVMDNQKILLVNLSKGKIGALNAQLLGLIFVSKINMAAMARADMLEEDRKDFYLYVDEFQNFATDTFGEILSEARKYRLALIMAHQFIAQI